MVLSHSFDLNKTGILQSPVSMVCCGIPIDIDDEVMLDYGAGTCHMTYPLWRSLGFAKIYFDEFKHLLSSRNIKSEDELSFRNLHMRKAKIDSKLGNGLEVPAYLFCLDKLILGENSNAELSGITVRLIDAEEDEIFVVGLNVLRYLSVHYEPSKNESIFEFSLKDTGIELLERDRKEKQQNNMASTFFFSK